MNLRKLSKLKPIVDISTGKKALQLLKMLYLNQTTKYPSAVLTLEKSFSQYIGTSYALSFCNGTSAFEASLFGLNLPEDSEALLPALSFHSVVMSVLNHRLNIKYLDSDQNMRVILDDSLVSERTKLIVIPHLFGYPQDMDAVMKFAQKHKLLVIEDCSHAHGATYKSQKLGRFGDISFFSFQGSKAIAGGEAGFAVTSQKEYWERMLLYMHMGRNLSDLSWPQNETDKIFKTIGFGRKGRMHPFAAALAQEDLNTLSRRNSKWVKKVKVLEDLIRDFPFATCMESSDSMQIGGFHYGIPIHLSLSDEQIAFIINEKNLGFMAYPYPSYEKYIFFRNHSAFETVKRHGTQKFQSLEDNVLKGIQTHRKQTLFYGLDYLYKIHNHSKNLHSFLSQFL